MNSRFTLIFGCILAIALTLVGFKHQYFVSIYELQYNTEFKTVELSARIFTEDLESTMNKIGAGKLNLGEANEVEDADKILEKYFLEKIAVNVNGKDIEFKYLGKEQEKELTWLYFEGEGNGQFAEVEVENKSLSELTDQQTNITYVIRVDEDRTLLLNKSEWKQSVEF